MDEKRKDIPEHKIIATDRNSLFITGVEDVESFDEEQIITYTIAGTLIIKGTDFKINRLNVDNGELEIDGDLDSITYSDSHNNKGSLWGKIFK